MADESEVQLRADMVEDLRIALLGLRAVARLIAAASTDKVKAEAGVRAYANDLWIAVEHLMDTVDAMGDKSKVN